MKNEHIKSRTVRFAVALAVALILTLQFVASPASARGGAPNIMSSPGYQRALKESRENYAREYYGQARPRAVVPARKWRHRAWRHRRY